MSAALGRNSGAIQTVNEDEKIKTRKFARSYRIRLLSYFKKFKITTDCYLSIWVKLKRDLFTKTSILICNGQKRGVFVGKLKVGKIVYYLVPRDS